VTVSGHRVGVAAYAAAADDDDDVNDVVVRLITLLYVVECVRCSNDHPGRVRWPHLAT